MDIIHDALCKPQQNYTVKMHRNLITLSHIQIRHWLQRWETLNLFSNIHIVQAESVYSIHKNYDKKGIINKTEGFQRWWGQHISEKLFYWHLGHAFCFIILKIKLSILLRSIMQQI